MGIKKAVLSVMALVVVSVPAFGQSQTVEAPPEESQASNVAAPNSATANESGSKSVGVPQGAPVADLPPVPRPEVTVRASVRSEGTTQTMRTESATQGGSYVSDLPATGHREAQLANRRQRASRSGYRGERTQRSETAFRNGGSSQRSYRSKNSSAPAQRQSGASRQPETVYNTYVSISNSPNTVALMGNRGVTTPALRQPPQQEEPKKAIPVAAGLKESAASGVPATSGSAADYAGYWLAGLALLVVGGVAAASVLSHRPATAASSRATAALHPAPAAHTHAPAALPPAHHQPVANQQVQVVIGTPVPNYFSVREVRNP